MQTIGNVCPSSKSEEESNASFFKDKLRWGGK